jgi:hypothetical protein
MALVVVDTAGRLSELLAVPEPVESNGHAGATNWTALFDAAGLPMNAFSPVPPRWVPPVYSNERMAWEGRLPERPDLTVRVEAAGYAGKPVFFGITGPWTQSSRTVTGSTPRLEQVTGILTSFITPALMLCGALLARRNLKLGRGDRQGAFRAATAVFIMLMAAWLLSDTHVSVFSTEVERFFGAVGRGLFSAGLLWISYLGLEPYVRRFSPASLIGWTRLLAGGWRDPHVGRDVAVGVAAGLALTLLYALHNIIPILAGRPEPMPLGSDSTMFLGLHYSMGRILERTESAVTTGMLGMAGYIAFRIVLKREWAAMLAAVACYVPVVVNGMFPGDTPVLDIIIAVIVAAGFVAVVAWGGLLATIATLAVHFMLLRAPLTTNITSWRGPTGLVFIATIAAVGVIACIVASGAARRAPRMA